MQVLAEGIGTWDGSTIVNAANPQRRDTQLIQPSGYLVVQIELGNAGVWPFHCHVAWHISEGKQPPAAPRSRIPDLEYA